MDSNEANTRSLDTFLKHRAALVEYAVPIVGCRARAEDVVQEAFIRFLPSDIAAGSSAIERPVAYLYRIVRNLALDWMRRQSMEHNRQADERLWWMLPNTPRTPEQEALYRDDLVVVESVLSALPSESRTALEMHRFGGFTMQEIADRLGVSVTKVHGLIRNAMLDVANELQDEDGGTGGGGSDE